MVLAVGAAPMLGFEHARLRKAQGANCCIADVEDAIEAAVVLEKPQDVVGTDWPSGPVYEEHRVHGPTMWP